MDEQEHEQLHEDLLEIRRVNKQVHSKWRDRYAGAFYTAIGFVAAYFFDGILTSITALALGTLWFSIIAGVFLKLRISAGRFLTIGLFEGFAAVCCALIIENGMNHSVSSLYYLSSSAFIYLIVGDLIAPILRFTLSSSKKSA